MHSRRPPNSGFVLLWMLVVGFLVLVSASTFNRYATGTGRSFQSVEIGQDLGNLQRWIVLNMSCANTVGNPGFVPAECQGDGRPMVIESAAGIPLVSIPSHKNYSQVGRYSLRAACARCTAEDLTCGSSGYKIDVQVSRPGMSRLGPLWGRSWVSLFDQDFQKEHSLPCPIDLFL